MADLRMPDTGSIVHLGNFGELGRTGIYFLLCDEVVVYVGQARNMRSRIGQHISDGTKVFDAVAHICCKLEALDKLERAYIERLLPKYNKCFADTLRQLGVESATGGRLVGKEKVVRIPRANVRRKITVLA